MSTNPFRRSSLKGSGSSTPNVLPADRHGTSPGPLSVDTRVPGTSQKHVNFASPPAIPISPASYPSSPESTRRDFSFSFSGPRSPLPAPTDYSQALASDPFIAEASDGEDDGAIGQALENAKANTLIPAPSAAAADKTSTDDAVRNTLGRFASGPRKLSNSQSALGGESRVESSTKPTMDVDAFKRMLLTGNRGELSPAAATPPSTHAGQGQSAIDTNSNTDTASTSQHSIFEPSRPPPEDSLGSSDDSDTIETETQRLTMGSSSIESRTKPPLPKSRRGNPLRKVVSEQGSTASFDSFINSLSLPPSRNVSAEIQSTTMSEGHENPKRTPPAPPLARRKSQQQAPSKPTLTRNASSRQSVLSEIDVPESPTSPSWSSKLPPPPPPPPSRRAAGSTDRRLSIETINKPQDDNLAAHSTSDERPVLVHTSSSSRRLSQLPPPVPPPRRGRGSSRSSVEVQRPSMAALGMTDSAGESSSNSLQEGADIRDILADLAALKKEVDAARAGAGQP